MNGASEIRAVVQARDAERVRFLQSLVRTPSIVGEEIEIQEIVEASFVAAGLETWRQAIHWREIDQHLEGSEDRRFDGRENVIGALRGSGGGRSLLLNAHVDTVPSGAEENWRLPPFDGRVEAGAVWGRGACDMKAGLTAALYALIAARDLGVELSGDVILATVVAEESGGAGSVMYAIDGERVDGVVVTEPTELSVAPGHAGSAQVRIVVDGQSAHACVRTRGVSAIEKFVKLVDILQGYERDRNRSIRHPLFTPDVNAVPLNIGTVMGGTSATIVPERCVADVRIGLAPGEAFATVRRGFEQRILAWAEADPWLRAHPPAIEWKGIRFLPSETPMRHPFVVAVVEAFELAEGRMPSVRGMTYGTDMSHFRRIADFPTVLFGPGNMANAHCADEHVPVAEVHAACRVLTALVQRWCG